MKKINACIYVGVLICGLSGISETANAAERGGYSMRAGLGTDITGGIAYGVSINHMLDFGGTPTEVGLNIFGGHFEEDSDEGCCTYHEETDVFVLAVMANNLYNYRPEASSTYYMAGIGAGLVSVEWEETSPNDTSLGTPLPGGGSKQSEDGSAAGLMVNFGMGYNISDRADIRFQVPILFITSAPGDASSVVPFFTVTAGYSF